MLKNYSYSEALKLYNTALDVCDNAFPLDQAIENEKVSLYCKMADTCLKAQPARAEQALLYASSATELDPTYHQVSLQMKRSNDACF